MAPPFLLLLGYATEAAVVGGWGRAAAELGLSLADGPELLDPASATPALATLSIRISRVPGTAAVSELGRAGGSRRAIRPASEKMQPSSVAPADFETGHGDQEAHHVAPPAAAAAAPAAAKPSRQLRISLKVAIALIFAVEILVASGAVFCIVYLLSRQVIQDTATSARGGYVSELRSAVRSEVLQPMARAVRLAATAFEAGVVSLPAPTSSSAEPLSAAPRPRSMFSAVMADLPTLYWIYVATDSGYFWGANRINHPNGSLATWKFSIADPAYPFETFEYPLAADGAIAAAYTLKESYDPRSRPWFKAARAQAGAPAWTPVYSDWGNPELLMVTHAIEAAVNSSVAPAVRYAQPGLSLPFPRGRGRPASAPHAGGPPLGERVVFAADTALRDVPARLAGVRVTPNTLAWVVDIQGAPLPPFSPPPGELNISAGYMVASNAADAPVLRDPNEGTRWLARESPSALVRASVAEFERRGRTPPADFDVGSSTDGVHVTVEDLAGDLGVTLLLFVAVPDSDLSRAWQQAGLWSIAGAAALVAVSVVGAAFSALLVTRPLNALTREMAAVLKLDERPESGRGAARRPRGLLDPRLAHRLSSAIQEAARPSPKPAPAPAAGAPSKRALNGPLDSVAMDVDVTRLIPSSNPFLRSEPAGSDPSAGLFRRGTEAWAGGVTEVLPLSEDETGGGGTGTAGGGSGSGSSRAVFGIGGGGGGGGGSGAAGLRRAPSPRGVVESMSSLLFPGPNAPNAPASFPSLPGGSDVGSVRAPSSAALATLPTEPPAARAAPQQRLSVESDGSAALASHAYAAAAAPQRRRRKAGAGGSLIREIHEMQQSFERMRYLAREVVTSLMDAGRLGRLGLSEARVTILFIDIVGFTTLTEQLSPSSMAVYLQYFLTVCIRTITGHEGTVDSFAGDQVMAIWNAPVPVAGHELLACRAALACQRALAGLSLDLSAHDGRPVRVGFRARIGLHTGTALVGNVGSEDRMAFTAIGDSVNLASRLESLCKHYGVPVLASGDLVAALPTADGRPGPAPPSARLLDRVVAKGKRGACAGRSVATDLYAISEAGPAGPAWGEYEGALRELWAGRAAEAAGRLAALRMRWPDDRPTALLLARAEGYAADPDSFSPVLVFDFK
eukprot:tig00021365_g20823.t1